LDIIESVNNWAAFLHNHRDVIAAMDFFTVPTLWGNPFRSKSVTYVSRMDPRGTGAGGGIEPSTHGFSVLSRSPDYYGQSRPFYYLSITCGLFDHPCFRHFRGSSG
jgi:hypothetical protein